MRRRLYKRITSRIWCGSTREISGHKMRCLKSRCGPSKVVETGPRITCSPKMRCGASRGIALDWVQSQDDVWY